MNITETAIDNRVRDALQGDENIMGMPGRDIDVMGQEGNCHGVRLSRR